MLTPDLSHYVLPDVSVVERFHEVLEYPQIRGIIITQTASDNVRILIIIINHSSHLSLAEVFRWS